jgi:hypothetical protein
MILELTCDTEMKPGREYTIMVTLEPEGQPLVMLTGKVITTK